MRTTRLLTKVLSCSWFSSCLHVKPCVVIVAFLPVLSGKLKRKWAKMLLSQSWMMKTLHFRMTQTNVNTRQRFKGTHSFSVFMPQCRWKFHFKCIFPVSVVQRRRKALPVMKMFLFEMMWTTRAMTQKLKGSCVSKKIGGQLPREDFYF